MEELTFEEFKVLAKGLKSAYTRENFLPDADALKIWYSMLKDIPYNVLSVAIQKYILSNKFSPTIAELREMAASVSNGDIPDWGEGWERVCTACRKFGRNRADEAMAWLDDVSRESVRMIGGFTYICNSENTVADRARFQEVYKIVAARRKQDAQMPNSIKALIGSIQERFMIEESTGSDK